MRRCWLSLCAGLALAGLVYSGPSARADTWNASCAVNLSVHNHAWVLLHGKRLTQCSGDNGCKCVSCYNWDGTVYAACYPLAGPIPH
jgi:hypothetical protein